MKTEKLTTNKQIVKDNSELVSEISSLAPREGLSFEHKIKHRKGNRAIHSMLDTLVKSITSENRKLQFAFINVINKFGRHTHLRIIRTR